MAYRHRRAAIALVLSTAIAASASAQEPAAPASEENLAKQLQNPIADLISVPFQNNLDFGIGPNDTARYTLNVQPVVPFSVGRNWNLITRTILPVVYQENPTGGGNDDFGLGDTAQSFFFSPRASTGTVWGVGPVLLYPTATDDDLGAEQWGAGPTAVALRQQGPWTFGLLANHLWSFAGDDDRGDVNATFLQPFLGYTWSNGFSLTANTESTYDWEADRWTVPLNLVGAKVVTFGGQPVSLGLGGRYYAERPDGGPDWGLRLNITFLFPK